METHQSLDKKLDKFVELIGNTRFSNEDLKVAAVSFFRKLEAANVYEPSSKYNGPVTLIKARDNFATLEQDYGLSEVSSKFFVFF